MESEEFLYILKKIFKIDQITIGDNGTVYIDQIAEFIEIPSTLIKEE